MGGPQLDSLADLSCAGPARPQLWLDLHPELNLGESEAGPAYRSTFLQRRQLRRTTPMSPRTTRTATASTRASTCRPGRRRQSGYPVLIFVHGWYGREAAPGFDFMYQPDSLYSRYIDAFVDAGFLVLSPALRGHGTVNGIPAEGIEFLDAWDNASYLSPIFYAIDVLNLLEGVQTLEAVDWADWDHAEPVRIDAGRIGIAGQSQGADAVLTALAVSGEGSTVRNTLAAGSIWSGCFGPRLEQAVDLRPDGRHAGGLHVR